MSVKKSYEDEMFEFYTTNDKNLEGLILANSHFDFVRSKIILSFWRNVKITIEKYLMDNNLTKWKVELEEDKLSSWSGKLYVFHETEVNIKLNNLPGEMICFQSLSKEQPYIGIWVNMDSDSVTPNPAERISLISKSLESELGKYSTEAEWFPFWTYVDGLNFSNNDVLLKLVGNNGISATNNCLSIFIDFFEAYRELRKI